MKYYLAVFTSITYANKIKKQLENQLGFTTLMHTPSEISANGCSYSLRFKEDKLTTIKNLAAKYGVSIAGIYIEENGRYVPI